MTELTTPDVNDLLYVVSDPCGTPADRKLKFGSLYNLFQAKGAYQPLNGNLTSLATANPRKQDLIVDPAYGGFLYFWDQTVPSNPWQIVPVTGWGMNWLILDANAADGRSRLNLVPGTDVQPYDPNLTQIAATLPQVAWLDPNYTGFWLYWSKDTAEWEIREMSGLYAASLYYDSTAAQVRNRLEVQPLDSDLTSIAALSTQTYGRSLLTQASAAATRTALEMGTTYTVYTAGTRPAVTASEAAMDWTGGGSVDPNLTLGAAGTYLVTCRARIDFSAATFAASRSLTLKLVRRNNTPGDVTNGTVIFTTPIVTGAEGTWITPSWEIVYTTANTDDELGLDWLIDTIPSSGYLKSGAASIVALRIQ